MPIPISGYKALAYSDLLITYLEPKDEPLPAVPPNEKPEDAPPANDEPNENPLVVAVVDSFSAGESDDFFSCEKEKG